MSRQPFSAAPRDGRGGDRLREQRQIVDRIRKDCEATLLECRRQREMIARQREFLNGLNIHCHSFGTAVMTGRADEAGAEPGGVTHDGE